MNLAYVVSLYIQSNKNIFESKKIENDFKKGQGRKRKRETERDMRMFM